MDPLQIEITHHIIGKMADAYNMSALTILLYTLREWALWILIFSGGYFIGKGKK